MAFSTAGQLARSAPTALAEDSLGLVADNLRLSHYGTVPILDRVPPAEGEYAATSVKRNGSGPIRILGLIDERDLSRVALPVLSSSIPAEVMPKVTTSALAGALTSGGRSTPTATAPLPDPIVNGDSSNGAASNGNAPRAMAANAPFSGSVSSLKAREVMRTDYGFVPSVFSLQNALLALDRYDSLALPVLTAEGNYMGLISRSDVVAALGAQVRPPMVGGMATPLGVWLTDGRQQAGAPPLGLFLSGLVLAACFAASHLVMLLGLSFYDQNLAMAFSSGRIGLMADGGGFFDFLVTGTQGILFLLAMRLTPLAGIHAAEHQTVWAIERGLELTPENVAQMPRAHPRCGTNLMALMGLLTILLQHLPSFSSAGILTSLLLVFLLWRQFGTILQEVFTTRPATRKQLESGIKAGREIIAKYQDGNRALPPLALRLLNSGMIWAMAGMILGQVVFFTALDYAARWILK